MIEKPLFTSIDKPQKQWLSLPLFPLSPHIFHFFILWVIVTTLIFRVSTMCQSFQHVIPIKQCPAKQITISILWMKLKIYIKNISHGHTTRKELIQDLNQSFSFQCQGSSYQVCCIIYFFHLWFVICWQIYFLY